MRTIEDVVNRLRAEFLEMPGLRLTSAQLQRLCGIDCTICQQVLDVLVDECFLAISNGRYARFTGEEAARPRAARAGLRPVRRLARVS